MEEIEVPLEGVHEEMQHHAKHATENWIGGAALTAAILAALAAVTAMLAGHHVNEAMIEQIEASDQWAFFQAKSIKSSVLTTKMELLAALAKPTNPKDESGLKKYEEEKEVTKEKAEELQHSSKQHLESHVILARGVTLYQVAIAVVAISVLTRRRLFWLVGTIFGLAGVVFLILGIMAANHPPAEKHAEAPPGEAKAKH